MNTDTTHLYYETQAEAYAAQSAKFDLTPQWDEFSRRLPPGGSVLDVGSGTGRDLAALAARGLRVEGLDYSACLAEFCRNATGCKVTVADLRHFSYPPERYDGVWCLASLLHIPRSDIPGVLEQLYITLKPGGLLMTSMQQGDGSETAPDGRFFEQYSPAEWSSLLSNVGFRVEPGLVTRVPSKRVPGGEIVWFITYGHRDC